MKHSFLGPRGWACLTVIFGILLATQFFRKHESTPDGKQHHDGEEREIVGKLPTTELVQRTDLSLPEWAAQKSKLDELMRGADPGSQTQQIAPSRNSMAGSELENWQTELPNGNSNEILGHEVDDLATRYSPWEGIGDAQSLERTRSNELAQGNLGPVDESWPDESLPGNFTERDFAEHARPAGEDDFNGQKPRFGTGSLVANSSRLQNAPNGQGWQAENRAGNVLSSHPARTSPKPHATLRRSTRDARYVFQPGFEPAN